MIEMNEKMMRQNLLMQESAMPATGKTVVEENCCLAMDVECPICSTVNHGLNLYETDGWFECENCRQTIQILRFMRVRRVPCEKYTYEKIMYRINHNPYK